MKVYLRVRSNNPSASIQWKYRVREVEALVEGKNNIGNFVPFISITYSWLEVHINEAQNDYPEQQYDNIRPCN